MTNNHIVPQILQSYECFRALEYDPLCKTNGTVIMSKTVSISTKCIKKTFINGIINMFSLFIPFPQVWGKVYNKGGIML